MKKLFAALAVLRYGCVVADPATLKNKQNLINGLIALLGAAVVFLPVEINQHDIETIASAIAVVVGLFNVYATVASTDKIGLWSTSRSNDEGVQSDEGKLSEAPVFRHPYDNVP